MDPSIVPRSFLSMHLLVSTYQRVRARVCLDALNILSQNPPPPLMLSQKSDDQLLGRPALSLRVTLAEHMAAVGVPVSVR